MTTIEIAHRVATSRSAGADGIRDTDLEIRGRITARAARLALVAPRTRVPITLAVARRQVEVRLDSFIPEVLRRDLVVEVGYVEQTIREQGQTEATESITYALAMFRGLVLSLARGVRLGRIPTEWGQADVTRVRHALPVVFGPSAMLSLAAACLHHAIRVRLPLGKRSPDAIRLSTAHTSPYPPHRLPLGRSRACIGGTSSHLSHLLLRADSWTRPLAALSETEGKPIYVRSVRRAPWPRQALVVDRMTPLSGEAGRLEWEGQVSVRDASGRVTLGTRPIHFCAGLHELARRCSAAAGRRRCASMWDPFGCECFGVAPPVLTAIQADSLLGGYPCASST